MHSETDIANRLIACLSILLRLRAHFRDPNPEDPIGRIVADVDTILDREVQNGMLGRITEEDLLRGYYRKW